MASGSHHGALECEAMDMWNALDSFEATFFKQQYKMMCQCQSMLLSNMRTLDHQAGKNLESLRSQVDKLVNTVTSNCKGTNTYAHVKNGHKMSVVENQILSDIIQVVDRFETIEHSFSQRHMRLLDQLSKLLCGEMKRTQEQVLKDLTDLHSFIDKIQTRIPKPAEEKKKSEEKASSSEESESEEESSDEESEKEEKKEKIEKKTDDKKDSKQEESSEEESSEEESSEEESEEEEKKDVKKEESPKKEEPTTFRKIRRPWEEDDSGW